MCRTKPLNLLYPSTHAGCDSPTREITLRMLAALIICMAWQAGGRVLAQSAHPSITPGPRRVEARSVAASDSNNQPSAEAVYGDVFGDAAYGDERCGSRCGDVSELCGPWWQLPPGNLEVRGEYLLWWGKGDHVPALVTTSPAGTPRTAAGVLGGNTSILLGDTDLNKEARSGVRVTLDYWIGADYTMAIEASYVGLGSESETYQAQSEGTPILARPYYNVSTNQQDSGLIAFPGVQTGSVNVADTTDFQSTEILLRYNWFRQCGARLDFLAGYRYMKLGDDLQINESGISTDPQSVVPVGTRLDLSDRFQTLNQFNGADLGVLAQWHRCRWSLDVLLKMALGSTSSRVTIDGVTQITAPGQAAATYSGAFLAQKTNIGQYEQNTFTVIPEIGTTVGYDLTSQVRLTAGYSLLYWSSVARPGEQIDTHLNPTQFPPGTLVGAPQPQFQFATSGFWAQGLNLGLDFRF